MDRKFWLERWDRNEIGFHKDTEHPALVFHLDRLMLTQGARVFLPLCGKTRDIGWLLSQGYRVAGAELSGKAVKQLFDDLGIRPTREERGPLTLFRAPGIDIFVGDIFDLGPVDLGLVDATYDRAALIALPDGTRHRYAEHLTGITGAAPQLLICLEYDQSVMNGPPFAVDELQVRRFYAGIYDTTLLASEPIEGGLKGRCEALETVWLLQRED